MTIQYDDSRDFAVATSSPTLLGLLTPAARVCVNSRRLVCINCSQNKRLNEVTVICEATGCAGVSLINGRCKRRKWPV